MKVGIVVPYSWSYWGGVLEHAQNQAVALRELGVETRTVSYTHLTLPTILRV